jgi:hypothetical protein
MKSFRNVIVSAFALSAFSFVNAAAVVSAIGEHLRNIA